MLNFALNRMVASEVSENGFLAPQLSYPSF
jgi:hypothetical protein